MQRIEHKIALAKYVYYEFGELLLNNLKDYLIKLDSAIESTWRCMRELGITDICRQCALETGSCCKRWIEDVYDETTLLVNLLLGVKLPEDRFKPDGCFFLGKGGCLLRARESICVTYLCDRILNTIGDKKMELYKLAGMELGLLSILKVKLKRFIDQRVPRSSQLRFWRYHHLR